MKCRVSHVRIFVSDFERAVKFYTEALQLKMTMRLDEFDWAQFDTGDAILAIERCPPDVYDFDDLVGRYAGVSLSVDDIASVYQDLVSRGVRFSEPPKRTAWGGVVAEFHDPDNNVITLLEMN